MAGVLLAGILIFFLVKRSNKTEKSDVVYFLTEFNSKLIMRDKKALKTYFDGSLRASTVRGVINLITGNRDVFNGKPLAQIRLDVEESVITNANDGLIQATIPVVLSHDSVEQKTSTLILNLHRNKEGKLKIIKADNANFYLDYSAYVNLVKRKTVKDEDVYSPITLAAFKVAKQLTGKYDSVVWFDHVGPKTYYYVIKGKMERSFFWSTESAETMPNYKKSDFKMGLVGPDLKEIIPTEYDLIHNLGGTLDGLIEVEKGDKKGFFDLSGHIIVPASYDQLIPLNDDVNAALLRKGDEYFYLTKGMTVTDRLNDFKIASIIPEIKKLSDHYVIKDGKFSDVMEFNAKDEYNTLFISPSYLVDLVILPKFVFLQNALRNYGLREDESDDGDGTVSYTVDYKGSDKKNKAGLNRSTILS